MTTATGPAERDTSSSGRRLLAGPERRASILAAAAAAFAQLGYAATSMDHVAQRAGVSKVLVYRHFAGKAELYRSVLEATYNEMAAEFEARTGAGEQNGAIAAVLAVARRQPNGVRLFVRHASREHEFAEYVTQLRQGVIEGITPLLAPRATNPADLPWVAELAVTLVWEGVLE
ncbi:MAG: TetR/AcrR family transcriptional regulator, partial [Actinomycetota bacterium]|nr:TetR/AcrR family transcriptional regulator [Actinomycetota bacterium]